MCSPCTAVLLIVIFVQSIVFCSLTHRLQDRPPSALSGMVINVQGLKDYQLVFQYSNLAATPEQKLCSSLLLILGFTVVLPHLDT